MAKRLDAESAAERLAMLEQLNAHAGAIADAEKMLALLRDMIERIVGRAHLLTRKLHDQVVRTGRCKASDEAELKDLLDKLEAFVALGSNASKGMKFPPGRRAGKQTRLYREALALRGKPSSEDVIRQLHKDGVIREGVKRRGRPVPKTLTWVDDRGREHVIGRRSFQTRLGELRAQRRKPGTR